MDEQTQLLIDWLNENLNLEIKELVPGYRNVTNKDPIANTVKENSDYFQVSVYLDRIMAFSALDHKVIYFPDFIKQWVLDCDQGRYPELATELEWME